MPAPRQFDPTAALDSALQTFWTRGYEATSIQDLVERTGVNRASLYATFGGKRELFLLALERYDRVHREAWFAALAARHGPIGAITEAFEEAMLPENRANGCLLVNTALELSPHDEEVRAFVDNALASAEQYFRTMLELAELQNAEQRASALLALFVGVRVLTRSRPVEPMFDGIRAQVAQLVAP